MHDTEADPLTSFCATNVQGALNLARQAAAGGRERFVFVNSVKVNGECTQPGQAFTEADGPDPHHAYGVSKHKAELGLRQLGADAGMEVVLIRLSLVYGLRVKANFSSLLHAVPRLCGNLQVDISRARILLGWVPPVSVDGGLPRVIARMQKS